jgi:hypothetical protein
VVKIAVVADGVVDVVPVVGLVAIFPQPVNKIAVNNTTPTIALTRYFILSGRFFSIILFLLSFPDNITKKSA